MLELSLFKIVVGKGKGIRRGGRDKEGEGRGGGA
jgi:hypothetical protein